MTFTVDTKLELGRLSVSNLCCQRAQLAALIRLNGTVELGRDTGMSLQVTTHNAATARTLFRLFRSVFGVKAEVYIRRKMRLRKNNAYVVRYRGNVLELLKRVGLLNRQGLLGHGVAKWVVRRQCCRRAYLRGAFLAAGAITNPQRVSYHLEVTTKHAEQASVIRQLFVQEELAAKLIRRKEDFVVYLKDGEQIVTFLNIIGAHTSLLQFEEARVRKEMRNQVNRWVNAETANLNKTVDAAGRQIEAIRQIEQSMGLERLSPAVREMAHLRLQNPEASLQELGELAKHPLSKSAVNHRMRKLLRIARELPNR